MELLVKARQPAPAIKAPPPAKAFATSTATPSSTFTAATTTFDGSKPAAMSMHN